MKNYQNKITINDEEFYVRTEPVVIDAGLETSITVYTSYTDPLHDIAKISPADLKNTFENGIPVYYNCAPKGDPESILIVSALYSYNGEDLEEMELRDSDGITRLWVSFYGEPIGPGPELAE